MNKAAFSGSYIVSKRSKLVQVRGLDAADWLAIAAWAIMVLVVACACLSSGCAANRVADLKPNQFKDHQKLNDAKGDANPAGHPIDSTNSTIKKLHDAALTVTIIAAVAVAAFVGLYFTPLSWIATFGLPVSGAIFAFAFTGLVALPFFWWAIGVAGAVLLGSAIYEVIHYKGIKPAVQAAEAEVKSLTTSAATVAVATVNALHVATPTGMT